MKPNKMIRESNKNGGGEGPRHHPNRTRDERRRLRLRLCFLDKENAYIYIYIYRLPRFEPRRFRTQAHLQAMLRPDALNPKPVYVGRRTGMARASKEGNSKGVLHQDFLEDHPFQCCSGPSTLNNGVRMGASVLALV